MRPTASPTTHSLTTEAKSRSVRQRPLLQDLPTFVGVKVDTDRIWFSLHDGREISIPLAWSERLARATSAQRQNYTLSAWNVFWDEIDEIIGVENVLYGDKLYLCKYL